MRRTAKPPTYVGGSGPNGIAIFQGAPLAADNDSPNSIFEDESTRLKEALKSCRSLVANYRVMLTDSSNDNSVDEFAADDSEVG